MSEPVADHVPPLPPMPPMPSVPTDRLDVEATAAAAVDLDSAAATSDAAPVAASGRHRTEDPEPLTRAQRRAQAEAASSRRGRSAAEESSVLDHPAVLVGLSLLTLVALVVGLDQASQGNVVALLPAVLLVAAYVVVVRRRRSRR